MVSYEYGRVYLFRGKRDFDGVWIYGDLGHMNEDCFISNNSIGSKVDPDTVSQYIMGDDINGTRIFEGDIVKTHSRCMSYNDLYAIVVDKNTLIKDGLGMWRPQDTVELEVVGNIWDNLDLLDERTRRWINSYYRKEKTNG